MPFERLIIRSAALAATLLASYPAFAADGPLGVWYNDTGRGAIEIKQCGSALCGHVVWVKDTSDANGCGRQIIGDVVSTGGGVWSEGWIYSPEKKKNYNVELTPLRDGTLKVKGFAGVSFLSKTMIWTKAPDDLPRCGEQQAAAPAPSAEEAPEDRREAAAPPPRRAAPPPVEEQEVAEGDDEGDGGNVDISDIGGKFSDAFSRKDGKCKLDLPWVKMDFDCKKRERDRE